MSSLSSVGDGSNVLKFSKLELLSLVDAAKSLKLDGYQISVLRSKGFDVTTCGVELESIEHINDCECQIKVFKAGKVAAGTTSALNRSALLSCLQRAAKQVSYTSFDDCNVLPEKKLQSGAIADCDLYHPWDNTIAKAADAVVALSVSANKHFAGVKTESANITSSQFAYEFIDSNGFYAQQRSTRHSMSLQMIAGSGSNMQTDSEYTLARNADALTSMDVLSQLGAQKTKARLNPKTIKSQRLPILLSPEVAAGFWGHIINAISGGALIRQSSFLQKMLHKSIAPDWLQLVQRPHIARAIGSAGFDSEGVLTSDRNIITDGVLESFILSCYTAKKLGMQTTANAGGIQNLLVSAPEAADFATMLNKLNNGILVTDLMGQGIDIATGNYSRGASGFLVQNGEIKHPLHEFTIAGNLADLLKQIIAVGSDIDCRRSIRCGCLLIDSVQIAGG